MVDWPEGIPFFKLRSGYGAQPGENTLRTPMDVGPAKVRRRTTAAPSVITGSAYMTREQAQRFEEFWRDTLLDGALSFTLSDGLWRRRNLLVQSEDFSAGWVLGGLIRSDAASVINGATASELQNDGVPARAISQTLGVMSGAAETFTCAIENVDAVSTTFGIYNQSALTWIAAGRFTWATGDALITNGTGFISTRGLGTGPNGGALVQISVTGTGPSGSTRRVLYYPAATTSNTNSSIIHWAQLETAPAFTQYEPVGASYPATHVTRGGGKTYRIVGVPQFAPMGIGHRVSVSLEVLP